MTQSACSHDVIRELDRRVAERLVNWPTEWQGYHWPGYTLDHTYRVRNLSLDMGRRTGADAFVLDAAALLHDIAKPAGDDHAAVGARESEGILKELGVGERERAAICSAVATHVGLAGEQDPIENRILADADYIDANFGLIAVWRYITIRGHRRDPLDVQVREMESWLAKRVDAVARLGCELGRTIGAARYERMTTFCSRLGAEHNADKAGPHVWLWQAFTDGAERPDVQGTIEQVESSRCLPDGEVIRTVMSELRSEISGLL